MSLFQSTSNLHNHYLDCCAINISETIEHDCLSVLHKLHDQVNGLQLVQVVVQPLARLFNPASLATLAATANQSTVTSGNVAQLTSSSASAPQGNVYSSSQATNQSSYSNVTNSLSQHSTSGQSHDLDGISTTSTTLNSSHNSSNSHSRSTSFVSAFNSGNGGGGSSANATISSSNAATASSNPLSSSTSTYMMSPDTAQALIARLDTDRDVNWLMEIIGYGLSMPFSLTGEQDSVKDCCTIYCEWLGSALLPYSEQNEDSKYQQLSKLVPVPIRKDPNRYARKMLSHLYNVFLPRQPIPAPTNSNHKDQTDANLTAVSRQAVLCHRVLRTIESIAQNQTNLMDDETWTHLLALLLTVNDKLLSAPTESDDIGTQLHDRILGVLFELMLLASAKSIPEPELWRTFHEMCLNWRHRPALIDHWRRITLLLTKRIVQMSRNRSASSRPEADSASANMDASHLMPSNLSPIEQSIAAMNYDNLSQTWYRFLNLTGNPVELSDPDAISRTDEFYHSACASDNVLDPRQHPCLYVLPQIFLNSMIGLKDFIDSFLGTYEQIKDDRSSTTLATPSSEKQPQNQSARGSISSLSGQSFLSNLNQANQQPSQATTPTLSRRAGIKPLNFKSGKSSQFSHVNASTQSADASPIHEHPKSGSTSSAIRVQQQFTHQRPSLTSLASRSSQPDQLSSFRLHPDRPKCNSILHIFGDWLFSAALIGSELCQEIIDPNEENVSESTNSVGSISTATEIGGSRNHSPSMRRASHQTTSSQLSIALSRQFSLSGSKQQDQSSPSVIQEKITFDSPLSADSFESGQAEAMAILCKIFSSKTSTEYISPTYLSRFYLCLQHCLTYGSGQDPKNQQTGPTQSSNPIKRQLLASVLINSTTLLQKDLDGLNLLIPSFIKAIEFVFECSDKEVPVQPPPRQHNRSGSIRQTISTNLNNITNYDLRKACIQTLVNLLAYPLHFQDLVIRNCLNDSSPTTTFGQLRPRLLKLLFVALQTETDPTNMQILFGGLSLAIHDLAGQSATTRHRPSCTQGSKNSSASSGNNGEESSNSSLDGSLNRTEDTMSQSSFVFNSSAGFLIKSLHVTCHLLINIWKHDTQVSLAALEVLTTIARVSTYKEPIMAGNHAYNRAHKLNNNNTQIEMRSEYMQATKWICDYIGNQCSRPPPAHSRDMHSTIVAAYQCLSVWFYHHPYLLNDENCIYTLMEVIELGVSGQKSKSTVTNSANGLSTQTTISRSEKIMKPSSMRVREAAESLLNTCMTRATNDEFISSLDSSDTTVSEQDIADIFSGNQHKACPRQNQDGGNHQFEAHKLFKYFSDEDSIIFGFFEGLNHDPNTRDSVICLMRTPFGKHCWKLRFSYYTERSKGKIIANKTLGLIKRPLQASTPVSEARMFPFSAGQNKSLYFNNSAKFFPETLEKIPDNSLDRLATSLDDYIGDQAKDPRIKNDLEKISSIFSHQVLAEKKVISECSVRIKRIECEEPQQLSDLEMARMIVTHLGLETSLNSLAFGDDKTSSTFFNELRSLDRQSGRATDSVSIFYVRNNRTSAREILESTRVRHNVSLAFFEWLIELGQPTIVKTHSRWTGRAFNSWVNRPTLNQSLNSRDQQPQDSHTAISRNQLLASDHGGALFDGERMTLYWSDMCQELAFLVPHRVEKSSCHKHTPSCQIGDTNVIICWLECQDDMQNIPNEMLLAVAETGYLIEDDSQVTGTQVGSTASDLNKPKNRDCVKYYISPMKNGLYRVNLTTSFGRHWLALPLVDGMTIGKEILSSLIKESVLNLCRRRRLDADSYQPPHVKRRLKLQEICNSYKISSRYDSTEFYCNLFRSKV